LHRPRFREVMLTEFIAKMSRERIMIMEGLGNLER
jgi:hypothetical protein